MVGREADCDRPFVLVRVGACGVWADVRLGRVQACGAVGCAPRVRGHFLAAGDNLVRPGAFDAVGDGIPVPERADCPRLEGDAPGRVECPPPCCPWGRLSSSVDSSWAVGPGAEAAA